MQKLTIGFLYNLDTMLGDDNKAPFIIKESLVEEQTVYLGNDIPANFIVYNERTSTFADAEFQAGGVIRGEGIIETLSKLAIGNYSTVMNWDFNSNSGAVNDSAYSLWWDPRDIANGESFSVNSFYGQSVPPTIQDPTKSYEDGPFDLLLQVGANAGQQFNVQLSDVRATILGIENLSVLSHENANLTLVKIDEAIQLVSSERTKYGAYQNALEHINNNVSNYKANLTTSESGIRDFDIPKEVNKLTNKQILLQSAQAMLVHSNQSTQSILKFLKCVPTDLL
ncbi:flagellin [Psychrobacillus sp. OK032]|uniref:flagellin n=1 Tax=Psychrobacillus sp. OK032 TaxID=1884358 RepID=UPI0015A4F8E2|nr:flagellin [Psychrobacillus sp. OK032]